MRARRNSHQRLGLRRPSAAFPRNGSLRDILIKLPKTRVFEGFRRAGMIPARVWATPADFWEAPAVVGEVPAHAGMVRADDGTIPSNFREPPPVDGDAPARAGGVRADRRGTPACAGIVQNVPEKPGHVAEEFRQLTENLRFVPEERGGLTEEVRQLPGQFGRGYFTNGNSTIFTGLSPAAVRNVNSFPI
jgi:hypothetical protein